MQTYRVAFFKDLANSSGHQAKCLQQELEVEAEDVRHALHLTQSALALLALDIDGVEIRCASAGQGTPSVMSKGRR